MVIDLRRFSKLIPTVLGAILTALNLGLVPGQYRNAAQMVIGIAIVVGVFKMPKNADGTEAQMPPDIAAALSEHLNGLHDAVESVHGIVDSVAALPALAVPPPDPSPAPAGDVPATTEVTA